jgi:hypothetical protein
MSYAGQMLAAYPHDVSVDAGALATTTDTLIECAQAPTRDTDADLSEQNVLELVKCNRLCMDCTDVCAATVRVASRQTAYDPNVTRPLRAGLPRVPGRHELGGRAFRRPLAVELS